MIKTKQGPKSSDYDRILDSRPDITSVSAGIGIPGVDLSVADTCGSAYAPMPRMVHLESQIKIPADTMAMTGLSSQHILEHTKRLLAEKIVEEMMDKGLINFSTTLVRSPYGCDEIVANATAAVVEEVF